MRVASWIAASSMAASIVAVAVVVPALPELAGADELRPRPQHVEVNHDHLDHTPIIGPRHAPVTIDFFVNLDSSRSLRLHSDLIELSRRHPRRLRVVYRLVDSGRTMLAEAAMEGFAQGRFEAFVDQLTEFGRRHQRMPRRGPELQALSERAGVDYQRIEDAWTDGRHQPLLEANELYRKRRHAHRAPALLFNGVLPGLRTNLMDLDRLETSYDLAYAEARRTLDEGVPLHHLYESMLREVDAAIKPIPITTGAVDGAALPHHRGLLEEAPLVATPPGGHSVGPAGAVVTVHFYCTFLSTHCALLKRALDELRGFYPTEMRLVFHHMFPQDLDPEIERHMLLMHRAALCADEQGAFWPFYDSAYRDYLHRRQRAMPPAEQLDEIIGDIELDRQRHQRCMAAPGSAERVRKKIRAAVRTGVAHTPTVVIGGRMYPGSKSLLELRSLVEQELLPGLLERFAPTLERERAAQPRP